MHLATLHDLADPYTALWHPRRQLFRDGEQQFIVFTTGERPATCQGLIGDGLERGTQRQVISVDPDPHATLLTQVAGIRQYAIGHIDGAACNVEKLPSQFDACAGPVKTLQQVLPVLRRSCPGAAYDGQRGGGVTHRTADKNPVTGACAGAHKSAVFRNRAHDGAGNDEGAAGGIAANQLHAVSLGSLLNATRKLLQERLVGRWKCQREHQSAGLSTHGSQIGER